jgi:signal transduction histidine kinase
MFTKIFYSIINSGTNFQISLLDKRRVRLLNIIYIISIVSAETYSLIYSLVNLKLLLPLILFSNVFVIFCFLGILLNKLNKTILSQHLLCIILTGITCNTTFTQIGTVANSHFYFLLFALVPIIVWRLKQLLPILFYFSINTGLFIYAQFIWSPPQNLIVFPAESALYISIFTVLGTFISLLTALWINYNQIEENEKQLAIQSEKLEEMIEELQAQKSEILEQKVLVENLNQLLINKNQSLIELNATKDKFFSIISHDLKSPFNTILGFSEILSNNFNDFNENELRQFIENIHNSSLQTYKLLENLLEWSRSQSGGMEYKPEMTNIDTLLVDSIAIATIAAKKKQITIYKYIDSSINGYVDKDMFNTIIRNLLSNAIKYTHKKGFISISAMKSESNILITISDTGIGIKNEIIEDIFKISDKHPTVGTDNEKGTGIGLLLCREFIEKHGGCIWVDSEVGKGSTFSFTIPFNQ